MSQLLDNLEFKKNKKTSICLSFCFFGFFSNFRFDLGRKFAVVDLNSFVGSFFVVNKLFYQTNESNIQCRRVLDACIDPTLAIFAKREILHYIHEIAKGPQNDFLYKQGKAGPQLSEEKLRHSLHYHSHHQPKLHNQ